MTDQSTPLDLDAIQARYDRYCAASDTEDGRLVEAAMHCADDVPALVAEVERLRLDLRESDQLRERMAQLLTETAAALKGEPPPLVWHDWSDLPAVAATRRVELERQRPVLEAAKAVVAGWREDPDVSDSGWISDEARALVAVYDRYVAGIQATEED